jgi:1,4-alpha-glucan branching enzyme
LWAAFVIAITVSCGPSRRVPVLGTSPKLVAGGAIFEYENADAKKVSLVGDFNGWSPTSDPMKDENGDGSWTLFYPLKPGRYAYKFVVDEKRWLADPANPISEPDGFDGKNSIVVVLNGQ